MELTVIKSSIKTLFTIWNNIVKFRYIKTQKRNASRGVVSVSEAKRFVEECVEAVGANNDNAQTVADVLIDADVRGHRACGLIRLELIISTIKNKICNPNNEPTVLKESPMTMYVDGKNGLGPVISQFCIKNAIKKAKDNGIAIVAVKNSHFNGSLAHYTCQAVEKGMIGFVCSNTPLALCPTGARQPVLGTNPCCFGIPGEQDERFLFTCTSTVVSYDQIEMYMKRKLPLPLGWAKDILGRVTTDAADALEAMLLLPFGGKKGLGTATFIEILTSILTDSDYGKNAVSYRDYGAKPGCWSHCFIVVNVDVVMPNFKTRLSGLLREVRRAESFFPNKQITVAGDHEKLHKEQIEKNGGIHYYPVEIDICRHIARKLQVVPLLQT